MKSANNASDSCFTPKWLVDLVVDNLGGIYTDPCWHPDSHVKAEVTYTEKGLERPWFNQVFCNPPYSDVGPWLERCVMHDDSEVIALVKADPSVRWWNNFVWPYAHYVVFLRKRVAFDGAYAKGRGANFASAVVFYNVDPSELWHEHGKVITL